MYNSPITTMITEVQDAVARRFAEHTENMVYEEVRQIGVHVDKNELVKALQYDRQQYEKGYADAMTVLEDIKAEMQRVETGGDAWELSLKEEFIAIIDKYIGAKDVNGR